LLVLSCLLAGAAVGLLWSQLAPRTQVVVGTGGASPVGYDTGQFVAADGLFLMLTAGAGLLLGAVAWFALPGRRGPLTLVALAVGGVLAALVAWQVGHLVGRSSYENLLAAGEVGSTGGRPVDLRARGVLVGWPFAAVAAYLVAVANSRDLSHPGRQEFTSAG